MAVFWFATLCHPFLRTWKFQAVDLRCMRLVVRWVKRARHLRSLELRPSGATAKVSEELSRALQADRWVDGSMEIVPDGFGNAPLKPPPNHLLPFTLSRGAGAVVGQRWKKSDVLRWAMRLWVGWWYLWEWRCEAGRSSQGWCNSWGLLALHFVSSFEDLVPLLVPCELGRNTLWTFSFGAAFVPCARAIWDMLQFIAPARTRYKDGLGFLSLPVQMHVIRSGSKLRNTSKHKVDGLS